MSLQSGMQDRKHKFRPVLLGTGEVSEITHFAVCSSTRKSFERKASKCASRTHKILHPPPQKRKNQESKPATEISTLRLNLSAMHLQDIDLKRLRACSKSYIYNFFIVASCSCQCQDIIFYTQHHAYMVLKFCTVVSYQTLHCLCNFSCQNAFCVPEKNGIYHILIILHKLCLLWV